MFSLVIETDAARLHSARAWVADVFTEWDIDSYVARLALSELLSNVAKHTTCDKAVVRLYKTEAGPVLEVADNSPVLPQFKEFDLTAESGRGLAILQTLTRQVGWKAADGGGKCVYVLL
ncbi:ATP-binding protein [Actinomadura hibisca]|uniref:ATP-binding protein n=1 Tax=Actinomadura hibisca TaxID=68565 RepID=UPI00082C7523|nr:ATP-binding protein [Actinomadura hibisca]